jgi:DNA-binding MarR family transcriptional regulator
VNELDAVIASEVKLAEVEAVFDKWLYLPNMDTVRVTLGTVAANRMQGDPTWVLHIGPSGGGKTEPLNATLGLEEVHPVATLTEAALLSGVPKKDRERGAAGGVLGKIGAGGYGILWMKDFGSVLSMRPDTRASTLAALREVYDGSWDRPVGTDGGRVLHWHGKAGLIGGATTSIDRHHAVMEELGSRFLLHRITLGEREGQGETSLSHLGNTREMRAELRDIVERFFAGLTLPERLDTGLSDGERRWLVKLSNLVTLARSPVERDRYTREIEFIPEPEALGRFILAIASLLQGMRAVGVPDHEALELTHKVAFNSMPVARRRALDMLSETDGSVTTRECADRYGMPTTTARRTLEDLAAHRLCERTKHESGKADEYRMTAEIRRLYAESTVPAKSHRDSLKERRNTRRDIAGKVSDDPADGAFTAYLIDENGRCTRHPDEPQPWCLECKATGAA